MKFRTPQYRRHASGQATVHVKGKDFYLGIYGTPESKEAYQRIINKYLAQHEMPPAKVLVGGPLVSEVVLSYLKFAQSCYVKNGQPTRELEKIRLAIRPLRSLYANSPARGFGLKQLKAVRQNMIDSGLCRKVLNARIGIIIRLFHWAANEELVPATVHTNLRSLSPLMKGRSLAKETEPIKPVPVEEVEKVLPFMHPILQAMIQI